MFYTMATPGETFTIENLPPDRYAVLSMTDVKVVVPLEVVWRGWQTGWRCLKEASKGFRI